MTNHVPLVSVSMLTYNHEKYVGEAIRSVLGQTVADLELVIVDDGSTDATPQVIASFHDPRIVSIRQENQGPGAAANRAYRACRGRYIALMSGDDVCHADRLERQLNEYRRGGTRLLFSAVDYLDERGRPVMRPSGYEGMFDVCPQSRAEICHRFFYRGNFLNAITCFTETAVMQKFGTCDPLLLLLQDFDLWIRLLKKYEIHIDPQATLSYRIRDNGQNLSAPNPRQPLRLANEEYFVMRRFFDGLPPELFREAFRSELLRPECASPTETACEQAFLFLRSPSPVFRLIGIEKSYHLLQQPDAADVLRDCYQFDARGFMRLLGEVELFNPYRDDRTTLYLDGGEGFSEAAAFRVMTDPLRCRFTITFDLTDAPAVRRLRWDPVEGRSCRVRLDEVIWRAPDGSEGEIDLSTLESNGNRGDDGTYSFETTDPMFVFPHAGILSRLTLHGWWDVQTLGASIAALRCERSAHQAELATHQAELAAYRAELVERNQQLQAILTSRRWRLATKAHRLWCFLKGKRAA